MKMKINWLSCKSLQHQKIHQSNTKIMKAGERVCEVQPLIEISVVCCIIYMLIYIYVYIFIVVLL